MTDRRLVAVLSVLLCLLSTSRSARAQFIRDFDLRTIVNVGAMDVGPCTCVARPFTFPEFRIDARWGHGPAVPLFPGPRPELERTNLAAEAADVAAHIDEVVMRAFAGSSADALRLAMVAGAGIGVRLDETNTLAWFMLAALSGDDRSTPKLVGYRFLQGIGVAADPVTAAQWFRLGADRGDPYAMVALGLLYVTGRGVPVNLSSALRWWMRSNTPMAQRLLGDAYACGLGVERDLARAVTIYREAAARGPDVSQGAGLQLARMYREACGVDRDEQAAFELFNDEAQSGDPEAEVEAAELILAGGIRDPLPQQAYALAAFAALTENREPRTISSPAPPLLPR